MLTFKYGVSDGQGFVHFHDRVVGCTLTVSDEGLFGLRVVDGVYGVDMVIRDIDTVTRCSVVEKEGFSVDEITGLIRVDFPVGSEVFIPDELITYVQKEQKTVQFDCMRYSTASYQYGTFDGRNRVVFNGFSLPAPEFYDTREGLYCIVDSRIVDRLDLFTTDIVHTVVGDGCVVVEDKPGIMVHSPIGCDVKLPPTVWLSMKERGRRFALFVPVHVNGDTDWIPENASNLVSKSILNGFGDAALIEVPSETTEPGFDIRPELQRLLDDAAYRESVAVDIQKVFMKLPPSQRNENEAIRQVCEFASTMCK